jgi:hypothetical protein
LNTPGEMKAGGLGPMAIFFTPGVVPEFSGEAPSKKTLAPSWRHHPGAPGVVMHPLVLMFALSGSLMISRTLRIPKL